MTIIPCAPDAPDLLSFVLPYEKLTVGLVSHILSHDTAFFLVQADDGTPCNAFSFSDGGQILHCLPDAYGSRQEALLQVLTDFFCTQVEHEFFNIIGEKKGTELIQTAVQRALGRKIRHEQNYLLLENKAMPEKQSADGANHADIPLAVVRCSPSLIDDLLPLQRAYEQEEVLWAGEQQTEQVTRLSFLHALRTQQIFAIAKNGTYIAKGGTNAQGKNYVQLGGIYTASAERETGYATELLRHILGELRKQGKKAVLFVKPENVPALHLYKKCGFSQIGQFKITYY